MDENEAGVESPKFMRYKIVKNFKMVIKLR